MDKEDDDDMSDMDKVINCLVSIADNLDKIRQLKEFEYLRSQKYNEYMTGVLQRSTLAGAEKPPTGAQ